MENGKLGKSLNKEEVREEKSPVLPVFEEKVTIGKKLVEKAKVRLAKTVSEHVETYDVPVSEEKIEVKRIPKNEIIDVVPDGVRYEGDIMIIPVLKEVAVIEKRLMLVEEIHVSKYKYDQTETREVVLRTEDVRVERTEIITKDDQSIT
jgi:uncharacterized protein (TIGR02271 family)